MRTYTAIQSHFQQHTKLQQSFYAIMQVKLRKPITPVKTELEEFVRAKF